MDDKFEENYDGLVKVSSKISSLLDVLYEESKTDPKFKELFDSVGEIGIDIYEIRKTLALDFCKDQEIRKAVINNTDAQLIGLIDALDKNKTL